MPARAYVMCVCRSKQLSNDRPMYAEMKVIKICSQSQFNSP